MLSTAQTWPRLFPALGKRLPQPATGLPSLPPRSRLGSRTCATTTRCRDLRTSMFDPSRLPPLDRTERHNAPFFVGGYLQLDLEELS